MTDSHFADNIVAFARALRAAGLPVGSGRVIDAMQALSLAGLTRREDVFAALQSVFVTRHEHAAIFAQAFDLFFRPEGEWQQLLDTAQQPEGRGTPPPAARRVLEALIPHEIPEPRKDDQALIEPDRMAVSAQEILQRKDFAQMSAAEQAEAIRAMTAFMMTLNRRATRRLKVDRRGHRLDFRQTLRASLRGGGDIIDLRYRGRRQDLPPIVALLDISGSMTEYSRMFLHFLHAVSDANRRVSTFLFGTRLTNVTRALRARDPDEALAACSASVPDWSGGTKIASSLRAFNKTWGRRVLTQGAIVLLITDGLERDSDAELAFEMDRLHRSCRRLIWLNPLLRFEGFAPRAQGIKAMLPHVDEFRPVHNLRSMEDLMRSLAGSGARRLEKTRAA